MTYPGPGTVVAYLLSLTEVLTLDLSSSHVNDTQCPDVKNYN